MLEDVDLSGGKVGFLCESLRSFPDRGPGAQVSAAMPQYLVADVDEAIADGRADAAAWGVNPDALVARLRALPKPARFAVVDTVERFWLLPAEGQVVDRLRAVGLFR